MMVNSNYIITQSDGYRSILYPIPCNHPSPLGSVLVLHGMAEHHERYRSFANFLNSFGYDVFLYDHRGHGTDKKIEELGFISVKRGSEKLVQDAITILKYIKENSRSSHVFVFGHSMGSLVLRNLLQQYDHIDAAILCGTTSPSNALTNIGYLVSTLICKCKGSKKPSPVLNQLLFRSKEYRRICTRTAFDWLSRSNPSVGTYINDPYCGYICSSSFYRDLIQLTLHATNSREISKTRKDLPILIISGSNDPVGGCGKQVTSFYLLLQKLGFTSVDCVLYKDCRHELLNELNRKEIMADIVNWLTTHCS